MLQNVRKTVSAILFCILCLVSCALNSCKDAPCQTVLAYKAEIDRASAAVKALGPGDYFFQGMGLSSKVKESMTALRSSVVAYRDHLSTCTNSHCEEMAASEIAACDEVIKQLDETMQTQDIAATIGKILGLLMVL